MEGGSQIPDLSLVPKAGESTKCRTFRFLDEKWNEWRHRDWSLTVCGRQLLENWVREFWSLKVSQTHSSSTTTPQ